MATVSIGAMRAWRMTSKVELEISSVRRALEIVSEPWTFLVLRECWFGIRRFGDFRQTLGIPRATLSSRLGLLVTEDMLERRLYRAAPARYEYRLTERGMEMYRPMAVILAWGDRWMSGPEGPPLILVHKTCGRETSAEVACSACRATVSNRTVSYRNGPGAGVEPNLSKHANRRSTRPENLIAARADSVARAMQIIGDRWSFLLIREGFFGRRRFDEVQKRIGIASNILSSRLQLLVEGGIFERHPDAGDARRMEYRFTDKGRDLYQVMLAFMAWGDRWADGGRGRPTILHHHDCGEDFQPVVVCRHCREEIAARDMLYRSGPGWNVNLGAHLLERRMSR